MSAEKSGITESGLTVVLRGFKHDLNVLQPSKLKMLKVSQSVSWGKLPGATELEPYLYCSDGKFYKLDLSQQRILFRTRLKRFTEKILEGSPPGFATDDNGIPAISYELYQTDILPLLHENGFTHSDVDNIRPEVRNTTTPPLTAPKKQEEKAGGKAVQPLQMKPELPPKPQTEAPTLPAEGHIEAESRKRKPADDEQSQSPSQQIPAKVRKGADDKDVNAAAAPTPAPAPVSNAPSATKPPTEIVRSQKKQEIKWLPSFTPCAAVLVDRARQLKEMDKTPASALAKYPTTAEIPTRGIDKETIALSQLALELVERADYKRVDILHAQSQIKEDVSMTAAELYMVRCARFMRSKPVARTARQFPDNVKIEPIVSYLQFACDTKAVWAHRTEEEVVTSFTDCKSWDDMVAITAEFLEQPDVEAARILDEFIGTFVVL